MYIYWFIIHLIENMIVAYVSGEKPGVMLETPYNLGESLNGTNGLDIDEERKIVEDKLKELKSDTNANDKSIKLAMKDLGMQRYIIFFFTLCLCNTYYICWSYL